jgi:hypothetical protein
VDPRRTEIARIEEFTEPTAAGTFCFFLLSAHQVGSLLFFITAKSAIQEAAVAAIWIGGNVLWGLGVALGRRRTYIVTRDNATGGAP